jgi:hypothetical protein
MALLCHIDGSMITAVWTNLWKFLNSKFYHFMFKCWIMPKPMLGGVDSRVCTWKYRPCECAQSNRACNIFNFDVLGLL